MPETQVSLPKPDEPQLPAKVSKRKIHPILLILVTCILLLVAFTSVSAYLLFSLKTPIQGLQSHGMAVVNSIKTQDLPTAKAEIDATKNDFKKIESGYSKLSFWAFTPLRWHYQDGTRIINSAKAGIESAETLVAAIEPYADVLGFKGAKEASEGDAEERVAKLIATLDVIKPQIELLETKLAYIDDQINQINPMRYPLVNIKGKAVSTLITESKFAVHQASTSVKQYKPLLTDLPQITGFNGSKQYLVLFQNDGELRPTGGFMTAFAIIKVEKGKAIPVKSDDIYELDRKFTKRLEAPEPIKKYLENVPYWYLRDMNLSPDFKVSMDTFATHYKEVPGEQPIDGIIAVNTKFLTQLVSVLGPIDVAGYGVFTAQPDARCDCPQIVYALENMITKPTPFHRNDRKGVLGPLMQTILRKAYDAPKEINPALFQTALQSIQQKNVLFYFFDGGLQKTAEAVDVAGRIKTIETDYLHINDANFGGAKSNIFVTQEVELDIEKDGQHQLTMVYKNPQKASNCNLEAGQLCLNGVLRDWVRVYLPKGSQLVENMGFEADSVKVSEDLDKTVIEGFFKLNPQSQATLKFTYKTPMNLSHQYQLLIQKQSGTTNPKYIVKAAENLQEFELSSDKTLNFIIP